MSGGQFAGEMPKSRSLSGTAFFCIKQRSLRAERRSSWSAIDLALPLQRERRSACRYARCSDPMKPHAVP